MTALATPPAAVYSPALRGLQATVADSFALVMEARNGVPATTAFDVAALLKLSADELAHINALFPANAAAGPRYAPAAMATLNR